MKKVISICVLIFFVIIGNAQVNTKPKLNELSQDQLNLALTKSYKTIGTGKILTFTGLSVGAIGLTVGMVGLLKWLEPGSPESDEDMMQAGFVIMTFGAGTSLVGIPVWIVGASKKHKITLELAKFNTPGFSSINGIGLKMRF